MWSENRIGKGSVTPKFDIVLGFSYFIAHPMWPW